MYCVPLFAVGFVFGRGPDPAESIFINNLALPSLDAPGVPVSRHLKLTAEFGTDPRASVAGLCF
jgi:hypothetical protein